LEARKWEGYQFLLERPCTGGYIRRKASICCCASNGSGVYGGVVSVSNEYEIIQSTSGRSNSAGIDETFSEQNKESFLFEVVNEILVREKSARFH